MSKDVSIFLPTRKGSERAKNKNTRDFCSIKGGLLHLKLTTLLKLRNFSELVLSTNDEKSVDVASLFNDSRIRIDHRPESLCLSETKVEDLIRYVPSCIKSEHILWTHVTAPFLDDQDYSNALDKYFFNFDNQQFDSLLSVTKLQQFIWDNELRKMINFDISNGNWPRTQDLKPLYEVNHAFYINSRENYLKYNNRISPNLDIFEIDKIKSFDIDWEEDFMIAESIYGRIKSN